MKKFPSQLSLIAVLAASLPAWAQTAPPNAGETLRELRQQPQTPPASPSIQLRVPADADTSADPQQRFPIVSVRISGNVLIGSADLQPLVAALAGREVTLAELRAAAARITALYRERGFVVARAFVPAQALEGGVVAIQVLEGQLNSQTVHNESKLKTAVLEAVVAAQHLEGKTIQAAGTDRELLLLADLPAVGPVSGNLKPGAVVGSSDMLVSVGRGLDHEGQITLDNYGNRYTGQTRLNGNLNLNSPLGLGDRLALSASVSDQKLLYGRAAFDLPANDNGLRAGAALSSSQYQLGREFENLDARGSADTAGLNLLWPALRGLNSNVWLSSALEQRSLKDDVRSTDTVTRKAITALSLAAYGDHADALGGGGFSTWRLGGTAGRLDIRSAAAVVTDEAGPRTAGSYRKLEINFSRLQAITAQTSLFAQLGGQLASRNLDSSEKFAIGGIYGVRGFPQGEGTGDDGWLANLELRHSFTAGIQGALFYDAGHVKFNDQAYAAGANTRSLGGWGVSATALYGNFSLKATLAARTGAAAVTAPDQRPRAWVAAGWSF
jgi:hemolysin activation/secretion protein